HGFTGPRGFDTWLRAMEKHTTSVNVGSFLGAGTVRGYAKGMADGPATAAELDTMRRVVRDAMLDGAVGVGSALIYPPGSYATFESLCTAATPAGVEVVGFTVDSLKKYEGKRLTEIAQAMHKDWSDALVDLTIAEQNKLGQVIFVASDSNVAMQVRKPWMKFG